MDTFMAVTWHETPAAMKSKLKQGGHALWKTGKMVKKKSLQGKIREFEILLKIREKLGNLKKILSL